MIKRLVTDSDETLNTLVNNIKAFFTKTDNRGKPYKYLTKISSEKRKFLDPDTKAIVEKTVEVLHIVDTESKDESTVKMIPLIKPGEMKFEIGGDNETTIQAKIKDSLGGKGQWKDYNKNTLKTKLSEEASLNILTSLKEESLFKIEPNLAFDIYKVLSKEYPTIADDHTASSFFYLLNKNL